MAPTGIEILNLMKKERENSEILRKKQTSIRIHKHQLSNKLPAVGRLEITFPYDLNMPDVERDIQEHFSSVSPDHKFFKKVDDHTFHIELRSFHHMYTRFDIFIAYFKDRYANLNRPIEIDGSWEYYE